MSTDTTLSLRCSACSRTFGRQAHLDRHALTHSTDYPFSCLFCGSKYKRSDALRRHWKTCSARLALGSQIPERTLSGKRKQVCDRCADRKRACSQGQPCTGCLRYEAECTYQRVKEPRITRDSNRSTELIRKDKFDASKETSKAVHRFDFLRNFTHASGIDQAYNYKRCLVSESELSPERTFAFNPWEFLFDDIEAVLADDQLNTDLAFPDYPFAEDPVHLKTREIWDTFRRFIERNPNSAVSMTGIVEFFSPGHLVSSLDLFWDRWYPHCPIIHRPTFEISRCPALLLSTMVLIGTCTSPHSSYRNEVKDLLDMTEEIIFSNPMFLGQTTGTSIDEQSDGQKISVLQATYFMCIMQKWDGNDAAKLRIQRNRFTVFVAATRAMGLARATHRNLSTTSDFGADQWHRYIENEEMIRTFNYVFLLDCAFVIFHNSVPRMVLAEMNISLTCPEDWFQAPSPSEFLVAVQSNRWRKGRTPLLTEVVRDLFTNSSQPEERDLLLGASKLNLFTIASAIHGLIFHEKMSFTQVSSSTGPIGTALQRWGQAWEKVMVTSPSSVVANEAWKEDGFMQHAGEFAALARVHLQQNDPIVSFPQSSMGSSDGGMATFDQTTMKKVSDLIQAVEGLSLL